MKCLLCFSLILLAGTVAMSDNSNIARNARLSVSSTRDPYIKGNAIDGDPSTSWSCELGQTSGQWLQLEWDSPQSIAGVLLHQTGLYIHALDVLVEQGDHWVTVGAAGVANQKPGMTIPIRFKPVTASKLRINFTGGVALTEIEVHQDAAYIDELTRRATKPTIAAAGDSRGGLIGTVSLEEGALAVEGAEVTVSGSGKAGNWQRGAVTGGHGLFEVELPLGARGPVSISARKDDVSATSSFDASDFSVCLTPMPAETSKDRISLEGTWDFAVDPPDAFPESGRISKWSKIRVPAHWEMEGFVSEKGKAVYRRALSIPSDWAGKRIKFRAESIYSRATVYVNNHRIGAHEGGTTPFEFDITDSTKPGSTCEITILVDERSAASNLDHYSFFSYFELAGIWRPLEVFAVEPLHVSRLLCNTTFDADYRDAVLSVDVDLANEQSGAPSQARVEMRLLDPAGKQVKLKGLSAESNVGPWERKRLSLSAPVESPRRWTAETPELYTLVVEVNGVETIRQPVGFRQIDIKGKVFTINGKPAKLWGISRLEAHPLEGRALSKETIKQDMDMIRAANANAIRMTICPPHPYTLDLCDQYGIYVENEGAYCWTSAEANDLRCAPLIAGISNEYFERDRNHPSVVIWSICNESSYGRGFIITHDLFRKYDPSRPTSAGQSAHTEIATFHNPTSRQRMIDAAPLPIPVFFDEGIAAFHGWAMADAMDLDPGLRDLWVTGPIDSALGIRESDQFMGVQLFSWVDDNFMVPGKGISLSRRQDNRIRFMDQVYKRPGRGVVGDYVWGIIDGWRRPKPEYWLTKKLFSPISVDEKSLALSASGALTVEVENRGYFADLDRYTCKWTLGSQTGKLRPSVAPQSRGRLTITPKSKPGPGDALTLEFYDVRGGLVDGYRIATTPLPRQEFKFSGKPAKVSMESDQGDWLSRRYLEQSVLVRLMGKDTEIALDKVSGQLMRGLARREMVLYSGFDLHINRPNAPLPPNPQGWALAKAETRTEGGIAAIDWNGSYGADYTGGFTYKMDDSGNLEVAYDFVYTGAEFVTREIGLTFEIPLDYDRFEWDRNAEWSYYPNDHIGRPHGVAVAHPAASTKPRPYGLDDHPWGCNDFRSAKRNVNWASFTDPTGRGIRIISDGTQAIRATMGVHSISVKVLDYYGGSPSPIPEYAGLYGYGRTVKTGERLKGVARIQLEP